MSKGWRFEPVVSLGTIIQLVVILFAIISSWHKMDKILVDHEARIKSLERGVFGQAYNNQKPNLQYEPTRKPGS